MFVKKLTRIVLLLGLMLSVGILSASAVPILSIAPSTAVVQPSQSFSLDISITDALDLYAFQFDLAFDPAILSAGGITEGPFLPTGGATFFIAGTIDNVTGAITFTADTLQTAILGVDGSGTLATVSFQALALGTSPITLSSVVLLDSNLGDITASTADGTVMVSAVPEPSTWLLIVTGCVGLIDYGWRSQQWKSGADANTYPAKSG